MVVTESTDWLRPFIVMICQVGVFPHKYCDSWHSEELNLLFIVSKVGGKWSQMVAWCSEYINTIILATREWDSHWCCWGCKGKKLQFYRNGLTGAQEKERQFCSFILATQEFTQQQFVLHQTDALCHCNLLHCSLSRNTGSKIIPPSMRWPLLKMTCSLLYE